MTGVPLVSIVVPHYNGKEILYDCLRSLSKTAYARKEVIVVDNASTDGSVGRLEKDFPWVRIVLNKINLGYAGGCNAGLQVASGEFILFLNNDTMFQPDWLNPLVDRMMHDKNIAAVQPKLLALHQPDTFDYSGAAGGLMDIYGFPFALGRIFFDLEKDARQYDDSREIFWGSGTAFLTRRKVLEEVGAFDPLFFAHMEEIDLCWRFRLAGHRVVSEPKSVVLHNSGSTLPPSSFFKMYLNHRNSLLMLLKNYRLLTLLWIFPVRVFLEWVAMIFSLLKFDFTRAGAILAAFAGFCRHLPATFRNRSKVQKQRCISDSAIFKIMYRRPIVFDYFVRKITCVQDLSL